MQAGSMFSTLLQWLASASGDEAKTGGVPLVDFPMPETPLKDMRLIPMAQALRDMRLGENRHRERFCCAMGQRLPQRSSLSLDPTTLWNKPHTYLPRNAGFGVPNPASNLSDDGGTIGFVYTRHGGFIDLGHARDFIDYTRYFASLYQVMASSSVPRGGIELFTTGAGATTTAHLHLRVEQAPSPPDFTMCALLGAKLAFEFSLWHEIESYFTIEKYSSFAPEDMFSNAVGVVAGFRALVYPTGSFDRSADSALKHVLELLDPSDITTTELATQYVKDHWWKTNRVDPRPSTLRRNFLTPGPIRPWLVTDLAIPGRQTQAAEIGQIMGKPQAASITIPTHYNGVFLEGRAHLVFKNLLQDIGALVPTMSEIRSIDLLTVTTRVRDLARAQEGATIDQP